MDRLPLIKGQTLLKFLHHVGFQTTNFVGSHARLKADDGRVTTISLHDDEEIPRGLLRKIIREDLKISREEFLRLYSEFKRE